MARLLQVRMFETRSQRCFLATKSQIGLGSPCPPTMAFAAPAGGGNGPGHCAVAELWCLRETGQSASVKCAWMCSQAVFGFKKREIQIVQNPRVAQAEVLCSKCDLSVM